MKNREKLIARSTGPGPFNKLTFSSIQKKKKKVGEEGALRELWPGGGKIDVDSHQPSGRQIKKKKENQVGAPPPPIKPLGWSDMIKSSPPPLS